MTVFDLFILISVFFYSTKYFPQWKIISIPHNLVQQCVKKILHLHLSHLKRCAIKKSLPNLDFITGNITINYSI